MQILNIGPLELVAILVLALIIMGPKDLVKTGAQMGKFVRKIVKSPTWRSVVSTSQELKELPAKLVQETGIKEEFKQIEEVTTELRDELKVEAEMPNIEPVSIRSAEPEEPPVKESRF